MALTIPAALAPLLAQRGHRLALLWRIDRVDGTTLRFTTHSDPIRFDDGTGSLQTFEPGGSWDATATRLEGMKDRNVDMRGAVTSDKITLADLRAKKYHRAEVTEYLVDWRYPFGSFRTAKYWVNDVQWDGEQHNMGLTGLTTWLSHKSGKLLSRTCREDLGGPLCGYVDGTRTTGSQFDTVTGVRVKAGSQSASAPRRTFQIELSDLPSGTPREGEFTYGKATWTTGANTGVISEIKLYKHADTAGGGALPGYLELFLRTPYDIADADEFTLRAGCDRLTSTCSGVFENIENHQAEPRMPGTDDALETP